MEDAFPSSSSSRHRVVVPQLDPVDRLLRPMRKISALLLFLVAIFCLQSPCYVAIRRERTLAIIKPDGIYGNFTCQIKQVILQSGFIIVQEMMIQLDVENATLLYSEHSEKSFFPSLVEYMTSGPVLIMVIEKDNAIVDWRALIGPTDARKAKVSHPDRNRKSSDSGDSGMNASHLVYGIRAMCGSSSERNCVHGSDSPESAAREISFFFGNLSPGVMEHDEL